MMRYSLFLFCFSFVSSGLSAKAPAIRFSAEMILAKRDLTSIDHGTVIWENEYEIHSGEPVSLTYMDTEGAPTTFTLSLSLPTNETQPGRQAVVFEGYWDTPDGRRSLAGMDRSLMVDGELSLTLFKHPHKDEAFHLRILPEVLWPEASFEKVTPSTLELGDVISIFNDHVIARYHGLQASQLRLEDEKGLICTLSTDPRPGFNDRPVVKSGILELHFGGMTWELALLDGVQLNTPELFAKWNPERSLDSIDPQYVKAVLIP